MSRKSSYWARMESSWQQKSLSSPLVTRHVTPSYSGSRPVTSCRYRQWTGQIWAQWHLKKQWTELSIPYPKIELFPCSLASSIVLRRQQKRWSWAQLEGTGTHYLSWSHCIATKIQFLDLLTDYQFLTIAVSDRWIYWYRFRFQVLVIVFVSFWAGPADLHSAFPCLNELILAYSHREPKTVTQIQ